MVWVSSNKWTSKAVAHLNRRERRRSKYARVLFSLIYFFVLFSTFYILHNYDIPQAMPHAIPQTHSIPPFTFQRLRSVASSACLKSRNFFSDFERFGKHNGRQRKVDYRDKGLNNILKRLMNQLNGFSIVSRNWISWDGKTESLRKLSNFNFQWTKTLYQNNLKSIAFFFTFSKG